MAVRCVKIGIANFRAFGPGIDVRGSMPTDTNIRYVDLDDDIIVLIGGNNCGKSTILHAYDAARQSKKKLDRDDFFRKEETPPVLEIWLKADAIDDAAEKTRKWYDPDRGNVAIVRKVWSEPGAEATKYSYDWERGCWDEGGFGGWDSILQSEMPAPLWLRAIMSEEELAASVRDLVKEIVFARLHGTLELSQAEVALEALSNLIAGDAFLAEFGTAVTSELAKTFPEARVSVSNPPAPKGVLSLFEKQAQVEVELADSPKLAFSRHGHGLQRQCALSLLGVIATETAKIEREKARAKTKSSAEEKDAGRILLIEEPELFLSPSAVRAVRDNLYALASTERFQVLAATHSPLLVDFARPKQTVARVWKHPSFGASVFQIGNEFDLEERNQLGSVRAVNPYYSEAFFSDEVIICEGESEAAALSELLSRVMPNLASRYFVLAATGGNNVPIYQRLCTRFGIPHSVLYDLESRITKKGAENPNWIELHKRILRRASEASSKGVENRLLIQVRDFESAHGLEPGGDKRRKALEFARTVDLNADNPALHFCRLLRDGGDWPTYTIEQIEELDAAAPVPAVAA